MTDKTSIKIICILIYSCAVVIVPPIPNLYTFTINCLAYPVTIAVSSFIIYFLNTRHSSNKNILNRILVLCIAVLILKSIRDFLVSFVACFWNQQLAEIIESYPGIIFLLANRYYKILWVGLASGLSAGRLLLFVNPVIFHQLQPTKGAMVVAFITLCVGSLDLLYIWTVCGDDLKRSKMLIDFSVETGIDEIRIGNTSNSSQTLTKEEDAAQKFCYDLPVIPLVISSAIFMEMARFIYSVVKEYKKNKKAGKISPSLQNTGHSGSLKKVQDLDVEAERVKDTRKVPRGALKEKQRSKSLPRFKENFEEIKTDSSLMTTTPWKLISKQRSMSLTGFQSQDCLSARKDQEDQTNSFLVVSDRNLTRNQGKTLLIRVQVHDAPTIRRHQVNDAPTIRRDQVHDAPTIRRDQVHDAPTIRRDQVDLTDSFSRVANENSSKELQIKSTEAGIIERDDVQNLSVLQSTANPTLNRQNIETPSPPSREVKNPESSNLSPNKMRDFTVVVRNNFKQHCLKTGSFITMNIVIGFIFAVCVYIFPSFTNISLMMFLHRLSTFVIIILLALFDKDIIECFEQKIVHFSP